MTRAGYSSIDELPLSAQARSLWGKTDRDAGEQWLPLYVHMSDSALVAKQIWDEWLPEGTRKIIADEFDGDAVLARKTTMFLAGIHDLGKATPVFQSKPITYAPNAADGSMAWIPEKAGLTVGHFDNPNNPTHPLAGEFLLERYLKSIGWSKDIARSYASIVGSHHGKPPIERKLGELEKSRHRTGLRRKQRVFPASAGMIPGSSRSSTTVIRVPRKRGDDPDTKQTLQNERRCSPQARG